MRELLEKIKARGYWRVVIRPNRFVDKRIENISILRDILQNTSVHLRGWDFPHIDSRNRHRFLLDWVEQEFEWEYYLEVWRFYQSGQFVYYGGLVLDWADQASFGKQGYPSPRTILSVVDVVYRLTEIFEFASRLALSEAGDEQIHIEIELAGLRDRALWVDPAKRMPFPLEQVAAIEEFPYEINITLTRLIAESRELALKPALELFRRFGWDPNIEVLREMQSNLRA